MNQRRARWRTLMWIFIVAVVMNDLWELAQASLYVGLESFNTQVFWHCFVASVGDGVLVLVIVAVGWISFQRWDWFQTPGVAGYLVMLGAGLVLDVLVEWVRMQVLGRWEYTDKMPTIPGVGVGLVPIGQMLVLPQLIFRIVTVLRAKRN